MNDCEGQKSWSWISRQVCAVLSCASGLTWPPPPQGDLDQQHLRQLLASGRVKLVACAHVSNAIGTVHPIREVRCAVFFSDPLPRRICLSQRFACGVLHSLGG